MTDLDRLRKLADLGDAEAMRKLEAERQRLSERRNTVEWVPTYRGGTISHWTGVVHGRCVVLWKHRGGWSYKDAETEDATVVMLDLTVREAWAFVEEHYVPRKEEP